MRLPAAYPVDPEAAQRWLDGTEPAGEGDLLGALVDRSPILMIARMNRRGDWPAIVATMKLCDSKSVLYRTACQGLLVLARKAGARVATLPDSAGLFRVYFDNQHFTNILPRLERLFL